MTITPDPIHGGEVALKTGETLRQEFRPDPATYWRGHGILALLGGVFAGLVLVATGNPYPWTGPVAAALAIGLRAAYLRSEVMAVRWRLTDRRLLGPGLRDIALGDIAAARRFLGDVQVITRSGDKHLMKYMADASGVIAAIKSDSRA